MSWDINKVVLVGRLSADVELKYTPSGTAVAKFGLAVGGKPKQDGSDSVSFFNIVVWGKAGETCSNYLSKGKQIAIDGRLEQRSWTAQDGSRRSTVEVIAERVEFLGSPGASKNQNASTAPASPNTGTKQDDNFYDNTNFDPAPVDTAFYQSESNPEEPNF
jgi:single-strand DNA-binding protein